MQRKDRSNPPRDDGVAWTQVGTAEMMSSRILYLFLSVDFLELGYEHKKLDIIV